MKNSYLAFNRNKKCLKYFSFSLISLLLMSCQFVSKNKTNQLETQNTIIDFSKVDMPPSFPSCDSFIDKIKKDSCFRATLHLLIVKDLSKHKFVVSQKIDETIFVKLMIDYKGNVSLQKVEGMSDVLQKEIPTLDSLLHKSIQNLPKLQPAIKRGIPVVTQYQLPIKILLEE